MFFTWKLKVFLKIVQKKRKKRKKSWGFSKSYVLGSK